MSEIDSLPIIYGLEFQSRCLIGLYSNDDKIRFAAGTQSIRSKNQIHLLTYNDDRHDIKSQIFNYDCGEIWDVNAMTCDPQILITTFMSMSSDLSESHLYANMWKIPEEDQYMSNGLELLTTLPTERIGDVKQIITSPCEDSRDLVALIDGQLILMGYTGSNYEVTSTCRSEGRSHPKFNVGRWSPHHGSKQIATASDTNLSCYDIRSMKMSLNIENAHSQIIRDIDYNPNRQYYIVSGGDDCKIKIWDLRNCKSDPVKEIDDHSHWVWKVRFNPFHDELLLSGGSDSMVALHLAQSVSSECQNKSISDDEGDDKSLKEKLLDGIIQTYEEHEDSVYAVDWSPVDPWIFSSLSYDGRLVINQVPRKIKYNILL